MHKYKKYIIYSKLYQMEEFVKEFIEGEYEYGKFKEIMLNKVQHNNFRKQLKI